MHYDGKPTRHRGQNNLITVVFNLEGDRHASLLTLLADPTDRIQYNNCIWPRCRGKSVIVTRSFSFNTEIIVDLKRVTRNNAGQFKLGSFKVYIPMDAFHLKDRHYFVHSIICFSKRPLVRGNASGEYSVYQRKDIHSRWFELSGDMKLEVNKMDASTCVS